jgi:hypothetical protein
MTMTNQPTDKHPIPQFASIEEEAAFWDTHDTTDYDFRPMQVRVAKQLSQGITVRFDDADLHKLRIESEKKGIGPTTLIRMWVKEHLAA